ncbi:MAG: GNAT family N-acetyltransferase [Bacteroidota bacterium]
MKKDMETLLSLRALRLEDCALISKAFREQGWSKSQAKYEQYLQYQEQGLRDIVLAELEGQFAGYLTIVWESSYPYFKEQDIPEIVDFNVLQKFQRQGIGTRLMDEAERRIKKVSPLAGIGFGLTKDYGPAQILYINRGYKPDGNGATKAAAPLVYGSEITVDDDLVLHLIKEL